MKPIIKTLLHANSPSTRVDLCGSDYIVSNVGIPMILFFEYQINESDLRQAIVKALQRWHVLSGRIKSNAKGEAYIDCNNQGVSYEVFEHKTSSPNPTWKKPVKRQLRKYHPVVLPWQVENKDKPICSIQLHQYTNGSVFSLTCCHSVADGWGMWAFIDAISNAMQNKPVALPTHERKIIQSIANGYIERIGSKPKSDRLADTTKLQKILFTLKLVTKAAFPKPNTLFYLSGPTIDKIRSLSDTQKLSRQDIAIGIIATAMQLKSVGALANMRLENESAVPKAFSGNALTYKEFKLGSEHSSLTRDWIIKNAKAWRQRCLADDGLDAVQYMAHLEHRLTEGTIKRVVPLSLFDVFEDGILINNYSVFPIYKVDFGQGTAKWFEMSAFPFRGALLTETPDMDGGLILNLTADDWQLANVKKLLNAIEE